MVVPAIHPRRRVVDAILYLNRTGCAWRQLPHDFPPWATVFWYFKRWREDGVVDRLHDALRRPGPRRGGQRSDGLGGLRGRPVGQGRRHRRRAVRGFGAGDKVNGRKRHIVVDTIEELLLLVVITFGGRAGPRRGAHAAGEGEDGHAVAVAAVGRRRLRRQTGRVGRAGRPHHRGDRPQAPGSSRTFQVLPRRWVVERTFAWIVKCRRLDHDYERLPQTSEAMIKWAMIGLMVRQLKSRHPVASRGRAPQQPLETFPTRSKLRRPLSGSAQSERFILQNSSRRSRSRMARSSGASGPSSIKKRRQSRVYDLY